MGEVPKPGEEETSQDGLESPTDKTGRPDLVSSQIAESPRTSGTLDVKVPVELEEGGDRAAIETAENTGEMAKDIAEMKQTGREILKQTEANTRATEETAREIERVRKAIESQ